MVYRAAAAVVERGIGSCQKLAAVRLAGRFEADEQARGERRRKAKKGDNGE
jgi:hypothetical protein